SVDVPAMRWVGPGASPVDHADSQPAVTSRKEPQDSGFSASTMRRRYGSTGDAPAPPTTVIAGLRRGPVRKLLAGDGQAVAAVVVLVDPGRAFGEAGRAEAGEIGGLGLALDDPLGEAAPDGRRGLEGRARVAEHDPEAGHRGDLVDDRASVRAHHDHARPAASHGRVLEDGEARGQLFPAQRHVVLVDTLVELLRVGVRRPQLEADERGARALGTHPRLVEGFD